MLNNYLIYFYHPTAASGLPVLITQGYVFAGVLTAVVGGVFALASAAVYLPYDEKEILSTIRAAKEGTK